MPTTLLPYGRQEVALVLLLVDRCGQMRRDARQRLVSFWIRSVQAAKANSKQMCCPALARYEFQPAMQGTLLTDAIRRRLQALSFDRRLGTGARYSLQQAIFTRHLLTRLLPTRLLPTRLLLEFNLLRQTVGRSQSGFLSRCVLTIAEVKTGSTICTCRQHNEDTAPVSSCVWPHGNRLSRA